MNKRAAAAIVIALLLEEEEQMAKRRAVVREHWVSPFLQTRPEKGFFSDLQGMLRSGDPKLFKNFVRMSADDFDENSMIEKKDTSFRASIQPADRLAITR